jgi:hypothetical protein
MPSSFPNTPKILRGAFVEYGLSIPPLVVVFQFNPVQLSRRRSQTFPTSSREEHLREFHQRYDDLTKLRNDQQVRLQEEAISFDIRLDATDQLNDGDLIAGKFGIAPQLATLELMMHPKGESILGGLADNLLKLGRNGGFSFTGTAKPPMILFIWGIKRVLPVNINSMNITETEFSTRLDPIRATVSVNLTVIEGENAPYMYSKVFKEASAALNLASLTDITDVVIPG